MRFNPRARLDRSQVQVRRGGSSGGGRGGIPIPMGRAGGGIGGLLVILLVVFLSGGLDGMLGGGTGTGGQSGAARSASGAVSSSELTECETGEDANENPDCARLAVVNSIQSFWAETLPEQTGTQYVEADTVMFTGSVDTGCGGATSDVGPFYCPVRGDMQVYLDVTFFQDMLEGQLGARGGDFAEAYVLAHEYGHHIENLLGYMGKVRTQQGPESDAVRLELMADCLGGMWAKHATTAEDENGEVLILDLDQQDIAEAIDAAQAVGDDRIQQRSGGRVDSDRWTHGSAAGREYWFSVGYEKGTVRACDTWEADRLYPG
ncbi:neutral zinc metallopeptidase [Nocardioides caldifontis]|uniref:KPN_02809 family neutral zinc metallopeptidase n=1 Tax=Nocardioides caldifontis TaxID=2588938 RepID=UPI0011DFFE91|nr:neutral zinc metallopeptidase [Nocardioides caldifontis]